MSILLSAAPVELPKSVHVEAVFVLLSIMSNWMLFGFLWVQIYCYYSAFPNDRRVIKIVVFVILLLESVQAAALTHCTFQSLITGFTEPSLLNLVGTLWCSIPLITGLIAFITQGFYCYRVFVLTNSKYAVTVIGMLCLGQLVAAITSAIQTKRALLVSKLLSQKSNLITIGIWGGCSLACDVLICVIMTYYLKKCDTGLGNTHRIIVRITRLTIETGCVTTLATAAVLILLYFPGHPPYYELPVSIAAKTYSNAMMANLNSRIKVASNAGISKPPLWNESVTVNRFGSVLSPDKTQSMSFYRDPFIDPENF